ncbi:hypothetical protein NECID01_1960 [Nematocida sp. AWRm77]|nr:hypothetical protein NECID01_1960 [Nematocida sp. AWRm77]
MKKTAVILILVVLDAINSTQIAVDFVLNNENIIRNTIPTGVFKMVDDQAILVLSNTDNSDPSLKKNKIEEYTPTARCAFKNELEYICFRAMWDTNLSTLFIEDNTPGQEQIALTKDLFEKCLLTANYLDIQGEYAGCFAKNMAKYGLLGAHSADIISSKVLFAYNLSHDTFWVLLHAFLDQAGFQARITYPNKGQAILAIEKYNNTSSYRVDKKYTGPPQLSKLRTVLYSELGETPQEKERNEGVLGWLLSNIGGSSIEIHYSIDIASKGLSELRQTIQRLTKEHRKGSRVHVEGLSFAISCIDVSLSLAPFFQLVPSLSRLEISITSDRTVTPVLPSLSNSIVSCKSLKTLKISGRGLDTAFVSTLAKGLPNIETLRLCCDHLEDAVAEDFKACPRLTSLSLQQRPQTGLFIQKLAANLPLLKELKISCKSLGYTAAKSFQACPLLEKLNIFREEQSTRGFFVEVLEYLPCLQELKINLDTADLALAGALRRCPKLQLLQLTVSHYTPGFMERYLQDPLSSLRCLEFYKEDEDNEYSEEDIMAIQKAQGMGMNISAYPF